MIKLKYISLLFSFVLLLNYTEAMRATNKLKILNNSTSSNGFGLKVPCENNGNGNGNGGKNNSLNERRGTNVFTSAKTNATDAAGLVGTSNYTVPEAPYKVERCDQILQIKGKKIDLNDYCIKTDAFMTLSIYMANLFNAENPDKLVSSVHIQELHILPTILQGTKSCIKWGKGSNQFGFCYESTEIAEQIIEASRKFYECTKGGDLPLIDVLIESCDISKIDFTEKGPFGKDGPKYLKKILEKKKAKETSSFGIVDKSFIYNPMKLNAYYSLTQAPGS